MDIFPNPSTEAMTINLDIMEPATLGLQVIDYLGRQVYTNDLGLVESGSFALQINEITALPSGMYQVILHQNGKLVAEKKWMKM